MNTKFYSLIIFLSTTVIACDQTKNEMEPTFVENGEKINFASSPSSNSEQVAIDSIEKETSIFRPKPEPFKNEELPKTYTSRRIIKRGGGLTYNIFYYPGNIVRYDETDSNYVFVTAKSILKNSSLPIVQPLQDEVLYSNKINNKASFNASASIAGLSVDGEQLMELVIQDVSTSIAPDSLIDLATLKAYVNKVPADKKKNYFFIKSSLLTIVNYKKYSKADFSTKVNLSYVTAEGKVYSSKDKFSKERIVSLDLISFDDILDQVKQQ